MSTKLGSANWLIENKLTLHPDKCEAIIFASKCKCKQVCDFSVQVNDTYVKSQNNIYSSRNLYNIVAPNDLLQIVFF